MLSGGGKVDEERLSNLPACFSAAADLHFSPLNVIEAASDWLVSGSPSGRGRFVDLGGGVGTFCLRAAERHPTHQWLGVELRPDLLAEARRWRERYGLSNCDFIAGELEHFDLRDFDGAYLYNPLAEALDPHPDLGRNIPFGPEHYRAARGHLHARLAEVKPGFRLVSYFTPSTDLPSGFKVCWTRELGKLTGCVREA